MLWRAKPSGPLRGSPTIANGNVYVLTQDNQLYAINQADGKIVWAGQGTLETQGVYGVAAPAASQGTVVAGFSSGELNAYRYENGRLLWQDALSRTSISTSVSTLSDIDAAPVIDQGRVYALGQGGRMVALELSTGQRLWEQNFAGLSTPWIAGEWIFLVTDDARLVALARSSGKARWIAQLQRFHKEKKKTGAITWFGPVLAGNRLILTNSEGQIVYANPGTDRSRRRSTARRRSRCLRSWPTGHSTSWTNGADRRLSVSHFAPWDICSTGRHICTAIRVTKGSPFANGRRWLISYRRDRRPSQCRQVDAVQSSGRKEVGAGRRPTRRDA